MARLLYIKANPKCSEESLTLTLSDLFISEYQKSHPQDIIEVLDLYQTVMPIMDYEHLALYNLGQETEIRQIAQQFKSFDKCVIAAPVWNHSFPAMLKIYLDNIIYRHVTFGYQNGQVVGLCSKMKVLYIMTSGQPYEGNRAILNHHQSQIEASLSLIGVTQVQTIALLGRNCYTPAELEEKVSTLKREIIQSAQEF